MGGAGERGSGRESTAVGEGGSYRKLSNDMSPVAH